MTQISKATFTLFLAKAFKRDYLKAKEKKKESFVFNGEEVLVTYAKYVVEYLEKEVYKKELQKL